MIFKFRYALVVVFLIGCMTFVLPTDVNNCQTFSTANTFYNLTESFNLSTGSCLVIGAGASNIIIEGNNNTISCDVLGDCFSGLYSEGAAVNVTLRNVTLQNFTNGLFVVGTNNNWTIEYVNFTNLVTRGFLISNSANPIKNLIVRYSYFSGISGYAMSTGSLRNANFNNNIIEDAIDYGIQLTNSINSSALYNNISNVAENTVAIGIGGSNFTGANISYNVLANISVDPIRLLSSDDCFIENNTIINNSENGIYLQSSYGVYIRNNIIEHALNYGIYLINLANLYIEGNTISDILGSSSSSLGIGIGGQNFSHSTINDNLLVNLNTSGIRPYDGSNNNTISNNNVSGVFYTGATAGIWVYNSKDNKINNNVLSNLSNGIYLEATGNNANTTGNNVSGNNISNINWSASTGFGNALSADNVTYNIYEYNNIIDADNGIRMTLSSTGNNFTGNIINNSDRGLYISGGYANTFRDNYFYNSSVSGLQMDSNKEVSMINNYFWDGVIESNIVLYNDSINTNFINVTINKSAISIYNNGSLFYGWHFDINISYTDGARANNATVIITDNLGNVTINSSTNSNGSILEREVGINDWLVQWMQNSSGETNYTPYNISVTKSGVAIAYSGNFSLTTNLLLAFNLTYLPVSSDSAPSSDSSGYVPHKGAIICWKTESGNCVNYSIYTDTCPFYSSETDCIGPIKNETISSGFTETKEEIKKESFILKNFIDLILIDIFGIMIGPYFIIYYMFKIIQQLIETYLLILINL